MSRSSAKRNRLNGGVRKLIVRVDVLERAKRVMEDAWCPTHGKWNDGCDPDDYNELPVAILNSQGAEVGRKAFYPPQRCVVDPPCNGSGCWYCRQWREGK